MNSRSKPPTRLSRYTGKLYDRATGEYLGRIERHAVYEGSKHQYIVWRAAEPSGKVHEMASLKDARWVLFWAKVTTTKGATK